MSATAITKIPAAAEFKYLMLLIMVLPPINFIYIYGNTCAKLKTTENKLVTV